MAQAAAPTVAPSLMSAMASLAEMTLDMKNPFEPERRHERCLIGCGGIKHDRDAERQVRNLLTRRKPFGIL
jgi:hypothetical protein